MSEEQPTPNSANELGEILIGLREWRRQHPQAMMAGDRTGNDEAHGEIAGAADRRTQPGASS